MEVAEIAERVERIAAARRGGHTGGGVDRAALHAALVAERQVRAWLDASQADLARRLAEQSSFVESELAESTRGSLNDAGKTLDRVATLEATPTLAAALDAGVITAGHVDVVTRCSKLLDERRRRELFERVDRLGDVAAVATVEEFRRRVRDEARRVDTDDGTARLERQRRAARVSTWVDGEGMWNLRGRFDPVTGVRLDARIRDAAETLFADAVPDTAPADPIERQSHLRALALDRLLTDPGTTARRPGRPEFVVVIDADAPGRPGPVADWPIPVEIPARVLADLAGDADVHAVAVRNGVVLHAPGELDLGRTTRLASRAQRRALRSLYATCAVPGCSTGYDRCKLHHVVWWRHGGHTDLANLLPLCSHHHRRVHDDHWSLTLGAARELTIRFPDGSIRTTGPPSRGLGTAA